MNQRVAILIAAVSAAAVSFFFVASTPPANFPEPTSHSSTPVESPQATGSLEATTSTVWTPKSGGTETALRSPPKGSSKALSATERDKRIELWKEKATKANAYAEKMQRYRPESAFKKFDPAYTKEDAIKWQEQAQKNYKAQGQLRTLPQEKQKEYGLKMKALYDEIDAHPEKVNLYVKLSRVQQEAQLNELAIKTLGDALEVEPNNTQALLERAKIYHAFGYRRQAEIHYEKILKVDPDNRIAKTSLDDVKRRFIYHPGDPAR